MNAVLVAAAIVVLSGHVTDRTTGQALPGVTIRSGAAHTVSAASGLYRLRLSPGFHTLTASSHDVPPQKFSVTVRAAGSRYDFKVCSTTLDFHCGTPDLPNGAGGSAG
jgi:carboxypeptidase family protein